MNAAVTRRLDITAELAERTTEQEWPELTAYIFTRSGRFIASERLEPDKERPSFGHARIHLEVRPTSLIIKIGPYVTNIADLRRQDLPTQSVLVTEKDVLFVEFHVPKLAWWCWIKVPYLVRGSVEKQDGGGGNAPICTGEVDIYDVDVGHCLIRLPDLVIERIRAALIDSIIDPPPLLETAVLPSFVDDDWCGTPPKKPPFPPVAMDEGIRQRLAKLPDELAFAKDRFAALPTARARADTVLERMALTEKQTFLNREPFTSVRVADILYSNTAQLRDMLINKFQSFRFWLCWYPWIYWLWWPYCHWYSLEKLGTAQLQPDGTFAKTLKLSICRHDTPDLWFVVRQQIGGIERVIYAHHPVPCNTYWNHASNQAVHLLVTDPLAVACDPQIDPDAPGIYVMPLGIGWDRWYDIAQAHRKPAAPGQPLPARVAERGLYLGTDPYGTTLHMRMQFHDDLRDIGVGFYRWSFREEGTTNWTPIDTPITHSYLTTDSSGKPYIDYEQLGPKPAPVGGELNLFLVPDPDKDWVYDRVFAIWDTKQLVGNYELLLEMFDTNGAKITPAAGFSYFLPTGSAPSPVDDSLYVESDGGVIFQLHVDNEDTRADVAAIALGLVEAAECQFLTYALSTEQVNINYTAYHPNGFLDHYDNHCC